ncbi:SET and MYND domain-containing protein 5, partial [Operophtera brumata]
MEGFEVRISNSKKGKGLFATKMYEPGDIILEEDPLVSCQFAWNAAYRYLACDYCMRPLETPEQNVRRLACKPDIVLPHSNCYESNLANLTSCSQCEVLYCSEGCKQQAFATYHRTLCHDTRDAQHPLMILMEAWNSDPAATAAQIKQFCHRTVNEDAELMHKLLGDQFSDQLNTLREMTAAVINGEHVQEGSGLFVLQSACNHNCAPNAECSFPLGNHRLQLKASTRVAPGDEICISYLDE